MANKIYTIQKDGEELEKVKNLTAAKKMADTEGAEVWCEGKCVYQGIVEPVGDTVPDTPADSVPENASDTVTEVSKAAEDTEAENPADKPEKKSKAETDTVSRYRLKTLMNVRRTPSMDSEKAGLKAEGTIVEVAAIDHDWMRLTDGTYILYGGGEFAEKIPE